MSRLIDADKIIDSLGNSDMDFAIGAVIDEQPTAFDVEKSYGIAYGQISYCFQ